MFNLHITAAIVAAVTDNVGRMSGKIYSSSPTQWRVVLLMSNWYVKLINIISNIA